MDNTDLKVHYSCSACGGVSKVDGAVCTTEGCAMNNQPLMACDCGNPMHGAMESEPMKEKFAESVVQAEPAVSAESVMPTPVAPPAVSEEPELAMEEPAIPMAPATPVVPSVAPTEPEVSTEPTMDPEKPTSSEG
ncbi:hypothetical protein KKD03_01265 [Patescibacteria group bacterium]|nr:hypothetical protein [Patescibacteria group bacterium]